MAAFSENKEDKYLFMVVESGKGVQLEMWDWPNKR